MCAKCAQERLKDMIEKKEYEALWSFLYENRNEIPTPFNDLFYRLRCYAAAGADGMNKNARQCLSDGIYAIMLMSEKLQ